jgi:DNA-directed RNA polymerase subunit P
MYKCIKCKKIVSEFIENRIMCPYCGYRILVKVRPESIKRVQAR